MATKEGSGSNGFLQLATKRIQRELAEFHSDCSETISAGMKENNIFHWDATIIGPEGTPYAGGLFKLEVKFPGNYPHKPPKINFVTRVYHCNIDSKGNICLNVLKDEWSPILTVSKLLLAISSLLAQCNPDDPLVGSIAAEYITNREIHDYKAKKFTAKFAT